MSGLYKFVLFFIFFSSTTDASRYFDELDSSKRYYFTIIENDEQVSGWLTMSKQGAHWHPEDELEPQLWIKKEEAIILDSQLEIATSWPLSEFKKLHPFVSAWNWLSQFDLTTFNNSDDAASLCTNDNGCFVLDWDKNEKRISWNNNQVMFILYLNKVEKSKFLFGYPDSWTLEYQ